jgi:hypothetical protein
MKKYKSSGWKYESSRHSLSAKGVKTGTKSDITKRFFDMGKQAVSSRIKRGENGDVFGAVNDILEPLPEIDYAKKNNLYNKYDDIIDGETLYQFLKKIKANVSDVEDVGLAFDGIVTLRVKGIRYNIYNSAFSAGLWKDYFSTELPNGKAFTKGLIQYAKSCPLKGIAVKKGITEKDVDPRQLSQGIAVEMEHTGSKSVAKKIALDHLAEYKNKPYYTELAKMEKKLET